MNNTSLNWPLGVLNPNQPSFLTGLLHRSKPLVYLGLLMLVCAAVTALAALFDERMIRGMGIWVKPIKFMLSTAAFALTTAWLMGLLQPAQRQTRLIKSMVWVLVVTAVFEVGYITVAAAMGTESHHNTKTPTLAWMYTAMGVAATLLTATQGVLAWAIWRNNKARVMPVAAQAVVIGLALTWVLGTISGFLLGGKQPPVFAPGAVPLLGWNLSGGDARPAHFLGLHAHQLIVLFGYGLQRHLPTQRATLMLWAGSAAYVGVWVWVMRLAMRVG
jgi:hypothetical protein